MGLTICEGIIRVHGGRIWAEPNTPRGVAFLFSLPVDRPQPVLPAREDGAETRNANALAALVNSGRSGSGASRMTQLQAGHVPSRFSSPRPRTCPLY